MKITFRITALLAFWASTLIAISATAQTPLITPTRLLPNDSAIGPAAGNQSAPAISQGGDIFLLAWTDSRAISTGGAEGDTARDIYAMRVDGAGNLLDVTPIAVTSAPASQVNPKVAWNGSDWLVVYEGNGPNGTGYYEYSLQAVRVSPAGQVLDATPISLYGMRPTGGSYWSVASDGNNWVVANQGTSTSGDIVAVRISPAGVVLDPPTRTLVRATYYMRSNIRLAYAGGVFLMTFNDEYINGTDDTKAVRFDASLNLLDAAPFRLLLTPVSDLTGAGSDFYMAWQQQQPDYSTAVYGSRINTAGQKLDGSGDNISGDNASGVYANIAATWDGVNWKVTWGQSSVVRAARVDASGQVLDPGGVAVPGPQAGLIAGSGNGGLQMVWSPYVNGDQGVVTAKISAANVAGPNHDVSIGAPQQLWADVATNGDGYMLVYRSSTGSGHRVLAQPLDASGAPATAEPVQLDAGDVLYGPGAPSVAWNGSLYLATWGASQGVVAQRLRPDGGKVDAAPLLVMPAAFGPTDVEAMGDTFLITGRKYGYTPEFIYAIAARVNGSTGALLDPAPLLLGGYYVSRAPAVTVLDGRWLVVYHSNWSHDESNASTAGVFVNPEGVKTAEFGMYLFSTAGGNGIFRVGLASSGSVALMVQSAEITSGVETDLLFMQIYPDGTLGPATNLTPWRGNQYSPRVAWDGTNFVIVYQEQRNRFADLDMLDASSDLFGMRVSPAGTIIDPQGFVFSLNPAAETYPNVTALNGVTLIAGSLMRNEAPFANYRIGYGQLGAGGNQWPVAVAAANPAGGDVPLTVNFNSAGSTDPDGALMAYAWQFGDGAKSDQPNPSHTYTTGGPYVAALTVTDNAGAQTTQTVLVKATRPNAPPVAAAVASPSSGPAPLDVVFYAADSYDPDGAIGNVYWSFSDGGDYWGATAYHTFSNPGIHTATVTVYDSRNATASTTVTVTVGPPNQAPIAVASANPTRGVAPLTVNFSSAGSTDPDGTIAAYSWNFGDGATSNQANPSHVYPTPGAYNVVLTVTDNRGGTSSAAVTITVVQTCTTNCLRSTDITLSSRARGYNVTVTGNVTVKNQNGARVRAATVYVTWTYPDGSVWDASINTNASGVATFSVASKPGAYTLTVTNIVKTGNSFDPVNSVLSKTIHAGLLNLGTTLDGSGRLTLTWAAMEGAATYRVLRRAGDPYFEPGAAEVIFTANENGSPAYSFTDPDSAGNADSFYTVEARDAGGTVIEQTVNAGRFTHQMTPGQ